MTNPKNKRFYGWIVVAGCGLRHFANAGTLLYSFGVFLPIICEKFGWSRAVVAGAFSLRSLLGGLLGPIAGAAMFKFGARKVMVYAAIVGALGLAGMSFISEVWHVYLFYGILVALGGGFSAILGIMTVINNWFIKRRSLAMGIALVGGGLGGFVFPPLIAWLTLNIGWQPTLLILAATLTVVAAGIGGLIIRNRPEDMGQVPDGIATEADKGTETRIAQSPRVYQTPIDWEAKLAMKQPTTWLIIIATIASGFTFSTLLAHQVAYLEDVGFSRLIAASALGLIPGASIIGRLAIGALATRFESRYLAALCLTAQAVAMVILLNATTLPLVFLYSALLGIASGGLLVIRPSLIGGYYGRTHYSQIAGWMMPFSAVFGALGPIVAGAIYDSRGTYYLAFIITLVLCGVGAVSYFFARPPKPPTTSQLLYQL